MEGVKHAVIDIHAHVIPGVDDGARTIEESVRLLELAASQGITAVTATPHYSAQGRMPDLKGRMEELRAAVSDVLPDFRLYLGQETYFHESLPERLQEGKALTLNKSSYVLVEFSPQVPYRQLFRGLRRLTDSGYIPVLAHMERYRCLREERNLEDLTGCGVRLQMNLDSLKGSVFSSEARWCRKQVSAGRIDLLATDMHRLDFRPPEIKEPLAWLDGHVEPGLLRRMLHDNAARILEAEEE